MIVRFTCLFLLLHFSMLQAQVVVNEFSASNLASYLDNYEKAEDWIELYNTSYSEVIWKVGTSPIMSLNLTNGVFLLGLTLNHMLIL